MTPTPKRLGAFAFAAAIAIGACSSSGSSAAPSAAAWVAPSVAPSTAASQPAASPSSGGAVDCETGSITAAGSTALQPLVDAAGKQYAKDCAGATISVQGGGSGTGLTQVLQGAIQIGDSDITAEEKLKPDEAAALVDHIVVRQGWVMVLNKGVTGVTNLTTAQAKDIWTGKITNWKDVGGNDQAIVLILRPASSGTRATFKKIVLGGADEATGQALTEDSNGAVAQAVKQTPGATSVIGFAYYQSNKDDLAGLQLDGVDATVDNIENGSYKLQAFGHMYTKGEPTASPRPSSTTCARPEVAGNLPPACSTHPSRSSSALLRDRSDGSPRPGVAPLDGHRASRPTPVDRSEGLHVTAPLADFDPARRRRSASGSTCLAGRRCSAAALVVVLVGAAARASSAGTGSRSSSRPASRSSEVFTHDVGARQLASTSTYGHPAVHRGHARRSWWSRRSSRRHCPSAWRCSWPRSPRAGRARITQPAMEVFVGIPSVVYGWLGITILVPVPAPELRPARLQRRLQLVRRLARARADDPADDHEHQLRRASSPSPHEMRTGSLALGTTRWQTIRHVLLPAALDRHRHGGGAGHDARGRRGAGGPDGHRQPARHAHRA